MLLIGVGGRKHSGKSTFANILAENLRRDGFKVETTMFAEKIKQAVSLIFGWSLEDLEIEKFKETIDPRWGITPRYAMVTLGTEWGRDLIHEHIWLQCCQDGIRDRKKNGADVIIVTDVRFENEAEFIRGGANFVADYFSLIQIQNPNEVSFSPDHRSENIFPLKPSDVAILNPKNSLDELEQSVNQYIHSLYDGMLLNNRNVKKE